MNRKIIKNNNSRGGQVMMMVVLAMAGVIIGATAISGLLTARQTRQTADSGSSAVSVFAADAGLEWRMYKLYADWKAGNLLNADSGEYECSDCDKGLACDKKPQFDIEKINNTKVNLTVTCSLITPSPDPAYIYYNIKSTAKTLDTSYVFQQTIKLIK